jgi:hypothetical protein
MFRAPAIVNGCYFAGGAAFLSGYIANIRGSAMWWLLCVALVALSGFLISVAVPAYRQARQSFDTACKNDYDRWSQAMERWNHLFYCSRCDNLYNPQTNQAAPVHQMNHLI